jgi:hypothetical protein
VLNITIKQKVRQMSDFKFFPQNKTKSDVEEKAVVDLLERGEGLLKNLQTAVALQESYIKEKRNANSTPLDGHKTQNSEEQKIANFKAIKNYINEQTIPAIDSLHKQITQIPHAGVTNTKFGK